MKKTHFVLVVSIAGIILLFIFAAVYKSTFNIPREASVLAVPDTLASTPEFSNSDFGELENHEATPHMSPETVIIENTPYIIPMATPYETPEAAALDGNEAGEPASTTGAVSQQQSSDLPSVDMPDAISTKRLGWTYYRNKHHATPGVLDEYKLYDGKYESYYASNTSEKVVYLTFDEGYENGNTPAILDILKAHNIKVAFFATKSYITKNPELVKRMVEEGHIVANHTVTHRQMSKMTEMEINDELKEVEEAFMNATGFSMEKYIRPPQGVFSEKSLWITHKLGYKTIFWSIDLPNDWNQDKQPTKEQAIALFKDYHHNGSIILLHAVSGTVTANLDEMLRILEEEGYSFGLITDIK